MILDGDEVEIKNKENYNKKRREDAASLKNQLELIQTKEYFNSESGTEFNKDIHLSKEEINLVEKERLRKLRKKETDRLRYLRYLAKQKERNKRMSRFYYIRV